MKPACPVALRSRLLQSKLLTGRVVFWWSNPSPPVILSKAKGIISLRLDNMPSTQHGRQYDVVIFGATGKHQDELKLGGPVPMQLAIR